MGWGGGGCIAIAYPNEQREGGRERGAQFPKDGLLFCAKMKREQGVVVSDASELLFEDIKKAERTTKTRCSNMPYLCNHQPAARVHRTPAYFYLFKLAHSTRARRSSLPPPPPPPSAIHLANAPSFGERGGSKVLPSPWAPRPPGWKATSASPESGKTFPLKNNRQEGGMLQQQKKNVFSSIKKYAAIRYQCGRRERGNKES